MSKRLLSLILAICLVFTALSPAAMAVEAGEDFVVNASQTAEESTETGSNSKQNSNVIKGEKQELNSLKNGGTAQNKPASGTGNGNGLKPTGGSWSFQETDVSSQVSLMNTSKKEALAELKLAAEVYTAETDVVAFVVMEDAPLVIGGTSINKVSDSAEKALLQKQDAAIAAIEKQILGGEKLTVRHQFTYLTNSFTVQTAFGNLDKIMEIPGVKSVFVAPSYKPSAANPLTVSSGQMVGAPSVWNDLGFTGKGMKIAIIDTGLDLDHPSFAAEPETTADSLTMADIEKVLTDLNAYNANDKVSTDLLYHTAKVPFAFNYADGNLTVNHDFDNQGDHGTHVSGIAAANQVEGTGVVGMAPDAQIIVMKVFGLGAAYADVLVAALEDAMTLGCDVANMSLGSANGFSSTNTELDLIYERLASQDIIFTASAGNEGTSSYGNMWGTDLNLTENIENATVGQPSTYANAMSIASAENAVVKTAYFEAAGRKVFYQDNYEYLLGAVAWSLKDLAGQELEYVIVPGLGGEDSYYDLETYEQITDVAGKVAIVMRGQLSFAEKCMYAEAMGAAAVIIWNNNDEDDIFTFGMTTADEATGYVPSIPVGLITYTDGAAMAEAETKTMTVAADMADRPVMGGGEMSSFSSWGTTSDLRLLPDITGVGGNVYSCYDGGNYGLMSGTSMSAPQLAGISALVLQYLREKLPNATDGELRDLAEALMMSTADVIVDSATGLPYVPRQQGAGLVDADGALLTDSYLTVGGAKPKAELGDSDNGVWKFSFEIHNFGDETLTYDLSAIMTTPAVAGAYGKLFMLESSVQLGGEISFSKDSVTLAPGEKTNITVTLKLAKGDKNYIDAYFPNGSYVEGYVYLVCEGGQDLNLPFLGFYGDWTDAPVFDTAFWYDNSFFGIDPADGLPEGSMYYNTIWTSYFGNDWVLGFNPYGDLTLDENGKLNYDPANNAISPNGDGAIDGIEEMYLSLMRNAKEMVFTYAIDGEVVHEDTYTNVTRTIYNSNYGQIVPWLMSWYGSAWDFAGVADGTTVDLTIDAYIDYGTGGKNQLHFPITVDLTGPQLTGMQEGSIQGTNYMLLQFNENVRPAAVFIQNPTGTQLYLSAFDYHMTQVDEDTWQVMLPVGQWGTELLVTLADYAGNEVNYAVTYTAAGENKPEMDTSALYAYRVLDMGIYNDSMFGWQEMDKATGTAYTLTQDMYEYYSITAAEYVDGLVFAVDAGYNLLALVPGIWNRTTLCNIGENVLDMSWDATTNTMYLLTKASSKVYLKKLDLMTGATEQVGAFGSYYNAPIAMTFDNAGKLYAVKPNASGLYTVDLATMALTAVTDADGAEVQLTLTDGTVCKPSSYAQSMTYSDADNAIYWAMHQGSSYYGSSALVTIDMATYATSGVKDPVMCEYVGLLMLEEDADYQLPYGGALQGFTLSNSALVIAPGESAELSISPIPWDFDTADASWTSSDKSVVTVKDGVVTAVGEGSATVTVTLGGISATCEVTVLSIAGDLYGYNYYSGDGAFDEMFHIDLGNGTYELLGATGASFISGDYNGHDGCFYGYTEDGQFWKMNVETFECERVGSPVSMLAYDMTYDYSTGIMYAMVPDFQLGATFFYCVDLNTGAMIDPSNGFTANYVYDICLGAAMDMEGNLYALGYMGDIHKGAFVYYPDYGIHVLESAPVMDVLPGDSYVQLLQSMCYDHNNDVLLWANADYAQLYWIDPNAETPYSVALGNPVGAQFEFTGLFVLPEEIPELPYTAVTSFTAADVTMGVGQTVAPQVAVLPVNATNTAVTLTSSDESIVKVQKGKLVGVAEGSATITATLTDGENTLVTEFTASVLNVAPYVNGFLMADLATYNGYSWIRIHTDKTGDPDYLDACAYDILGAERVGDKVYAYGFDSMDWTGNWKFFTMDAAHYTIENMQDLGEGFPYVYDMAYDYSNGTMYVLAGYTEDNIDLYVADMETGALLQMLNLEGAWLALAAGEGKVWLMQESQYEEYFDEWSYQFVSVFHPAKLYELDPATMEMEVLMDTGVIQNAFGSMTYDTATDYIYWAPMAQTTQYESGLYAIDPVKAEAYRLGTIGAAGAQMSGLHVVLDQYPEATATDVTTLLLNTYKQILNVGEAVQLKAQVLPMAVSADVTWTSSNEKVATVDENGLVTTHAHGAAIITATATKDGVSVSAQCRITALSDDSAFLTYNSTDMGWAAIDRSDLSLENLTEGEEVGVAAFAERKGRIYGIDTEGNLFYLDQETYARTVLGAVNEEALLKAFLAGIFSEEEMAELDLSAYRLQIRDMEYDAATGKMLVLGGFQTLGYYGDFEEMDEGNFVYELNLRTGELTQLAQLNNYNNKAMTVMDGTVVFYCAYDDVVRSIDLESGVIGTVANTYSQSLYGSTDVAQTLYYDDLADTIYLMVSSNDRFYKMVAIDPDSGEFEIQGDVGEKWREGYYDYGHLLNGLAFVEEQSDVQWVGNSLSTAGTITVNFYVALSSEVLADENARMVFNLDGKTQTVSLADAIKSSVNGVECYRFSCDVPAKSMTDTIGARMFGTEGALGKSYGYSIAKYYDTVTANYSREDYAELYQLVEAMLNYGAASQLYFDHNTENLANAKVPAAESAAIDASAFASVVSGKEENAEFVGSSLILEAGTTLRLFFRLADDAADHTFTVNGEAVEATKRGSLYYIELDGIAAKNLEDVQTFTCGGITVEISALSYVNTVLTNAASMDAQLVDVCEALYLYNVAANAYYK